MKKVVFIGNPNTGKTCLINALSGSNLKIGNWPGVTISKKEAILDYKNQQFLLIDLPGVYDLNCNSAEEIITREYILKEKIDLIINVIDSTNLSRDLYLTLNLMQLQIPMIIALNFFDLIKDRNINICGISNFLNIQVITVSALKNQNIEQLRNLIPQAIENGINGGYYRLLFGGYLEKVIVDLVNYISNALKIPENELSKFLLLRLRKQEEAIQYFRKIGVNDCLFEEVIESLEKEYNEEINSIIQIQYYKTVDIIIDSVNQNKNSSQRLKRTQTIDKILLNRFLGIPIFLLIIFFFWSLAFNGSAPLISWAKSALGFLAYYIKPLLFWAPNWFQSLLIDGLIKGVGGIFTFIPLIFLIFFMMAFLEESGYINRISFLLDRQFKSLGLSGNSCIPLLLGFGCTVPAIYALRTIENQRAKKITLLMLPFISCGARIPVYLFIGSIFFDSKMLFIILSLYLIGLSISLLVASILNRLLPKDNTDFNLIINLPPYHWPSLKILIKKSVKEVKNYINKTVKIIFIVLIILWSLTYFPNGSIEDSFIARGSKAVSFLFKPLGFGQSWQMVASLPGAIIAKESVVGFLSQLGTLDNNQNYLNYNFFSDFNLLIKDFFASILESIKSIFTFDFTATFNFRGEQNSNIKTFLGDDKKSSLKAYCFLIYILLSIPCLTTLAVIKQEYQKKSMFQVIIICLIVPYIITLIVFTLGSLIIN